MAKTLLDAVNAILKRAAIIAGDANELSSLTDSARQSAIDVAVQVINEGIDDLYSTTRIARPNGQGESAITLVLATRGYALAAGVVRLRWPMVDKNNTQFLQPYPGGYNKMLLDDPEQDDTGLPQYAAINPVNGQLYLDRAPTGDEAGRVYTYQFDKDTVLDAASDVVPFSDAVFRAMVPVWAQLWRRDRQNEFDGDLYRLNLGRAAGLMTQMPARSSYSPR